MTRRWRTGHSRRSVCASWRWTPTRPLTSTGRCTLRVECPRSTCGTWTTALRASCSSRRAGTAPGRSWAAGTPSTSWKCRCAGRPVSPTRARQPERVRGRRVCRIRESGPSFAAWRHPKSVSSLVTLWLDGPRKFQQRSLILLTGLDCHRNPIQSKGYLDWIGFGTDLASSVPLVSSFIDVLIFSREGIGGILQSRHLFIYSSITPQCQRCYCRIPSEESLNKIEE